MNYIKDNKDLNGKIVLLRLDLNVPINNGKITDETRIKKILPIINYCALHYYGDLNLFHLILSNKITQRIQVLL